MGARARLVGVDLRGNQYYEHILEGSLSTYLCIQCTVTLDYVASCNIAGHAASECTSASVCVLLV